MSNAGGPWHNASHDLAASLDAPWNSGHHSRAYTTSVPCTHVEEDQDVLILLEQEEAAGHGLAPWNGVTLTGAGANHLEAGQ